MIDNYFGIFFETLSDQEFKYINCEISKQKMEKPNYYLYLFFNRDENLYRNFVEFNKFDKYKKCWIMPLIDTELEYDLFSEIKEFITLPRYESILTKKGKKVHVAGEHSFVFDFQNLTKFII